MLIEVVSVPVFTFDVESRDKHGGLMDRRIVSNVVTTEGKNDLLNKYFAGSSYTATWYFGLVNAGGLTPTVAATDTAAQINGLNNWREHGPTFTPDYTAATRQAAVFGAASAGTKATSGSSVFTWSGNGNCTGMFICSSNVKDGTGGVLYCVALLAPAIVANSGGTFLVKGSFSC